MTHSLYTHNILVKNSNELVKNGKIVIKDGYIDSISSHKVENTLNDPDDFYIITPGFINLHCHLAYSNISLKSEGLFPWINSLMDKCLGGAFVPEEHSLNGAREALQTGTSFIVDNTNYPEASIKALKESGLKGLVAKEVFGSDPEKAEKIIKKAALELEKLQEKSMLELAYSPHSLYSVSFEIWHAICSNADLDQQSLTRKIIFSHFAEDIQEERWFKDKESNKIEDLQSFWSRINVLEDKKRFWRGAESSWDYFKKYILEDLLKAEYKAVLTHAINISEEEIKEISQYEQIRLVTCPRSNEFLKHNIARVDLWEKYGILYGLGTDSKASNHDLDMRKEALVLKGNFQKLGLDISFKRLFEILTIDAAKVLGLESEIGSLDEGKLADFAIWRIVKQDFCKTKFEEISDEAIFNLLLDGESVQLEDIFINGNQILLNPLHHFH